ncbi:MAG TPA: flagellar biosynthesis anti-sigma factor FlgM [Bryobacteraceae bacterium]|jgi:anti-sigma28 factor (negative regulator of flagellin synthesis)|nr:flagellar biosynthesis anti-sigma factor FlgM [Bryobacteraceae bacterium]
MRIDNSIPPISIGGTDSGKRADRAAAEKSAQSDQIQLSSVAHSAAANQAEKLESLRIRIANGTYRPSAEEVAGRMIDEMMR